MLEWPIASIFALLLSNHSKQSVHTVAAGKIEGDVRINGYPKEQASFARVSGYVEQFDTHTAAATVYEALLFSGTLRNGKEVDPKTTKAFVDQVSMPSCLQRNYQSHEPPQEALVETETNTNKRY